MGLLVLATVQVVLALRVAAVVAATDQEEMEGLQIKTDKTVKAMVAVVVEVV